MIRDTSHDPEGTHFEDPPEQALVNLRSFKKMFKHDSLEFSLLR